LSGDANTSSVTSLFVMVSPSNSDGCSK
jgi:hypothetical protein